MCTEIVWEPVNLRCGHTFCGECAYRWIKSKSETNCPTCRRRIKPNDVTCTPFMLKNTMGRFVLGCDNEGGGERIKLRDLEDHKKTFAHRIVMCLWEDCYKKVKYSDFVKYSLAHSEGCIECIEKGGMCSKVERIIGTWGEMGNKLLCEERRRVSRSRNNRTTGDPYRRR